MNKQQIIESFAEMDEDDLIVSQAKEIGEALKPEILKGIEQIIAHYQNLDDGSDEQ